MKKLCLVLGAFLCLTLLFTGCEQYAGAVKSYMDANREYEVGRASLGEGDALFIAREPDFYQSVTVQGVTKESFVDYNCEILTVDERGLLEQLYVGTGYSDIPMVPIFYHKNPERDSFDCSNFKFWPEEEPRYAILVITAPPFSREERYETDPYYGLEPWSTFGVKPIRLQDDEWEEGYPIWFYVVPMEKIKPEDQLGYYGFLLTGEDLLSKSWSPETGEASRQDGTQYLHLSIDGKTASVLCRNDEIPVLAMLEACGITLARTDQTAEFTWNGTQYTAWIAQGEIRTTSGDSEILTASLGENGFTRHDMDEIYTDFETAGNFLRLLGIKARMNLSGMP